MKNSISPFKYYNDKINYNKIYNNTFNNENYKNINNNTFNES